MIAEANKSEALIIKTQKRVTQETAVKRWYYRATQLSRELARTTEGGFDAVLARMDGEFANSLRVAVTRDLQSLAPGIEEASVEDLFREAKRRRYRAATYGSGTWLLGSDRAQAGLDDSKQKDPRKAQGSAQPDSAETEFQKRVQPTWTTSVARRGQASGAMRMSKPVGTSHGSACPWMRAPCGCSLTTPNLVGSLRPSRASLTCAGSAVEAGRSRASTPACPRMRVAAAESVEPAGRVSNAARSAMGSKSFAV